MQLPASECGRISSTEHKTVVVAHGDSHVAQTLSAQVIDAWGH